MAAKSNYQVGFVFGAKKAASFDKTFAGINSKIAGIAKGIAGIAGAYVSFNAIKNGVSAVVTSFGELEQNLGGSEAVFEQYATSIQRTGENAYKNLGVSQSEYLATANKMGALFQGSGIAVEKSYQLTERAMQRAADTASVMGIDMEMAMESVAGAAKGNFTMMDNLGVAMNATTIQAYALEKGINFKWNTASQAEKAELAMEMFFEKTEKYHGNFARESTQTVSGSFGLLKAAWSSFTAGLGNEKADMRNLSANVVDAFKAVVTNVRPIVKNIVASIPEAFTTAFVAIFPRAGPAITKISQVAGRAFTTIQMHGRAAIQFIKQKWDQYGPPITAFFVGARDKAVAAFNWIRDTAQTAIQNIQAKFGEIQPKIQGYIGSIVSLGKRIYEELKGAFEAAKPVITWIITNGFPLVVETAGKMYGVISSIYYFISDNWNLISPILYGVVGAFVAYKAITLGIAAAEKIKLAVTAASTAAQWALNAAMTANPIGIVVVAIGALIAIGVLLYKNWDVVKEKAGQLWAGIKKAFGSAVSWFKGIWDGVVNTFQTFMAGLSSKFPMLAQLIEVPISAIKGYIEGVKQTFSGIIDFVAGIFTGNWSRAWNGVKNIFGGVFKSFSSLVQAPINAVVVIVTGAVQKISGIWSSITSAFDTFMAGLSSKFPMLAQLIEVPINAIKGYIEGVKQTFSGIIDFVAGVFTGDWTRAWEGVKNIFGGIFQALGSLVKAPINAVIAIVNGAIRGINGINVTVPDWVPMIGGQNFGFAIPEIPMLAKGGIATAPTLAMVGEGREDEAILPLSKLNGMLNAPMGAITSLLQRFMDAMDSGGMESFGGGSTFNFNPQLVFNGPANKEDVQNALGEAYAQFKKFMAQYEHDKSRTTLKPRK